MGYCDPGAVKYLMKKLGAKGYTKDFMFLASPFTISGSAIVQNYHPKHSSPFFDTIFPQIELGGCFVLQ